MNIALPPSKAGIGNKLKTPKLMLIYANKKIKLATPVFAALPKYSKRSEDLWPSRMVFILGCGLV